MLPFSKSLFVYGYMCLSMSLQLEQTYLKTELESTSDYMIFTFTNRTDTYTDDSREAELLVLTDISEIECAMACTRYKQCYTYFFDSTSTKCHLINDICRTWDQDRFNCGSITTTESECRLMGCCFNPEKNVCFRSIPCNRPQTTPEDCAWPGVTSQQCHQAGCCENRYSHTGVITHGIHWCIRPK